MTLAQSFEPDKNPQLLYMTQTQQGRLQVLSNEHFVWLTIDGVMQTAIESKPPYISALPHCTVMLLPLLHDTAPNRILELGGGGLAIQRFLAEIRPHIKVTSVEVEAAIIRTVKKYFPASESLNVIHGDANDYVEQCISNGQQFDQLLVDLYHGQQSPLLQNSKPLLVQYHQLLSVNGWLVINCLTNEKSILQRLTDELTEVFGQAPKLFAVPGMLNHIFMLKKASPYNFPADVEAHNLNKLG